MGYICIFLMVQLNTIYFCVLLYTPDCFVPVWCEMCRTNDHCRTCLLCVVNILPLIVECVYGGLQYLMRPFDFYLVKLAKLHSLRNVKPMYWFYASTGHHLIITLRSFPASYAFTAPGHFDERPLKKYYQCMAECRKAMLLIASCCLISVQAIWNFWTARMLLCLIIITCAFHCVASIFLQQLRPQLRAILLSSHKYSSELHTSC